MSKKLYLWLLFGVSVAVAMENDTRIDIQLAGSNDSSIEWSDLIPKRGLFSRCRKKDLVTRKLKCLNLMKRCAPTSSTGCSWYKMLFFLGSSYLVPDAVAGYWCFGWLLLRHQMFD